VLINQIGDEPGQVILRQPLIQRRRDQEDLIGLERPKRLIHRPPHQHRRHHRRHLEQAVITVIRRHTEVSQRSAR